MNLVWRQQQASRILRIRIMPGACRVQLGQCGLEVTYYHRRPLLLKRQQPCLPGSAQGQLKAVPER